jgi:hypothetical protein
MTYKPRTVFSSKFWLIKIRLSSYIKRKSVFESKFRSRNRYSDYENQNRSLDFFRNSEYNLWETSVMDPDDFRPDQTFENVRFRIRILTLIKFRTSFFWKFFWPKYALKSIFMNQTVRQIRFLKYLWLLHTPKKLI